jgi:hypothetical protein
MIFDQPPAELPVATLRPHETGAQLLLDARRWLAARWRWLRPRAIPVAVAFAGMLGVLASANYLRELAHEPPEQLSAPVIAASRAGVAARPAAKVIVNRGEPVELKMKIGSTVYRLRIDPAAPSR